MRKKYLIGKMKMRKENENFLKVNIKSHQNRIKYKIFI